MAAFEPEAALAGLAESEKTTAHGAYAKTPDAPGLGHDPGHAVAPASAASASSEHVKSGLHDHDEPYPAKDGIHDNLEMPTDEDRATLTRVPDRIPLSAFLIAIIEMAERFSWYGCTIVFTNYIQRPLPPGSTTGAVPAALIGGSQQAGALNLGQRGSTGIVTFVNFWVYVVPLFGAYVADAHWGRFKTICVSLGIALVGHVLLTVSAVPGVINHPQGATACFIIAVIIMGIGTGGFKANISPLVAEQYKRTKQFVDTRGGKRVLVDPQLTTTRIYMYFYLFTNIGALVGQIAMVYAERYVGFWLAFLLPTVVFSLCPIVLLVGRKRYARTPPAGSVFATALRLWRYAARGRWSWNPAKMWRRMHADDFWAKAKPSYVDASGAPRPAWMIFDDVWVDEVRRGLKACTVFVWIPLWWLTYNQLNNNLVSQAGALNTHGLPAEVVSNLDPIALLIFIPICDLLIYPALRRAGFRFTAIRRMTLGFIVGSMAMVWAAVLQYYLYKTSPCGYQAATCVDDDGNSLTSPLNVWTQTGAYVLVALSEIFVNISGLEYAFTKAPKNMRSLVMGAYLFTSAIASALGEAFVSLSNDPLLIWNYGSMAVISGVAGVLFWLSFRHLDQEEEAMNNLDTGELAGQKAVPHAPLEEKQPAAA